MDLDLTAYIASVRWAWSRPRDDDTWETFWRRWRSARKKDCAFWRALAYVIKKEMEAFLEASLIHPFDVAYFLMLLVHIFFYAVPVHYSATIEIEPRLVETNSDPPQVFLPIPKIESSSACARSDSLLLA